MRSLTLIFVCIITLLTGCAGKNKPIDKAIQLRKEIEDSNGCTFQTTISADYSEKVFVFGMDCRMDQDGDITFTVTKPDSIDGIKGKISAAGGAITFDDQVLAFQTMADGLVSPVTAPWMLMKTLKSGYLKACTENETGFELSADDSYAENALHLNVKVNGGVPVSAEIFWNGRRVLTMTVDNFQYL